MPHGANPTNAYFIGYANTPEELHRVLDNLLYQARIFYTTKEIAIYVSPNVLELFNRAVQEVHFMCEEGTDPPTYCGIPLHKALILPLGTICFAHTDSKGLLKPWADHRQMLMDPNRHGNYWRYTYQDGTRHTGPLHEGMVIQDHFLGILYSVHHEPDEPTYLDGTGPDIEHPSQFSFTPSFWKDVSGGGFTPV